MNERTGIPVQFVTAGNSVRPEMRAMFESLMSAVLLGMETAERNLQSNNPPEPERESA